MATSTAKRIKAHAALSNSKRDNSPKWDGAESWSGEKFTAHFRESMNYYNLGHNAKDLKSQVINWMGRNGFDKTTISKFKSTKDWRCGITVGAIAACLNKGMPNKHLGFNRGKDTAEWLKGEIDKILMEGQYDIEPVVETKQVKAVVPAPTIQDRLRESSISMSEELEAAIDEFILNPDKFDPKAFKILSVLRSGGAKAAHARYIKGFFQSGYAELQELASGQADDQLREAYKHHPRKNVRKLIEFYEAIITACDQIAQEAKVLKKPRIKKTKPAEQIVSKLKFCVRDDKLNIVSQPPAQIIGAQALTVYNVKTRKIGYYLSKTSAGFTVRGTTLENFSEKSTQKTLRKPPEQLKEFKDQNTQKRFESWFNKNVKTTEVPLTGRFNEDVVILKIYK